MKYLTLATADYYSIPRLVLKQLLTLPNEQVGEVWRSLDKVADTGTCDTELSDVEELLLKTLVTSIENGLGNYRHRKQVDASKAVPTKDAGPDPSYYGGNYKKTYD